MENKASSLSLRLRDYDIWSCDYGQLGLICAYLLIAIHVCGRLGHVRLVPAERLASLILRRAGLWIQRAELLNLGPGEGLWRIGMARALLSSLAPSREVRVSPLR